MQLGEVRRALRLHGFDPGSMRVGSMMEAISAN
jgi:hypothetical protein